MKNGILTEICCGSLEDCKVAQQEGADGVELVCAHLLGGLTPSAGLLSKVKEQVSLPINAIIRPRMAGFFYTEEDFEVMCEDARLLTKLGADGIVFGFLKEDGTLDYDRCARFLEYTGDCETVFHRAIDVVPDPVDALEKLVSLGVTRILTSGGESDALTGAKMIRQLVMCANGRIQIMAGGGIRADTVAQVIAKTGVSRVHFSGSGHLHDSSTLCNPTLNFGFSGQIENNCYTGVNAVAVRTILAQI